MIYGSCALAILCMVTFHCAQQSNTHGPALITPLEDYKSIFDVTVICSPAGKSNISDDYKPKNFQERYMIQYADERKMTCTILPGFIDLADAQIASGALLLHYMTPSSAKKVEATYDSTPRSETYPILTAKAVCAPGTVHLTEEQGKKLLLGSTIAGKSFTITDKKTSQVHTCFLLTVPHKDATPAQLKQASQSIDSVLNPAFDVGIQLNNLGK